MKLLVFTAFPRPRAHRDADRAALRLGEVRDAAVEVDVPLLLAANELLLLGDRSRRTVGRVALRGRIPQGYYNDPSATDVM